MRLSPLTQNDSNQYHINNKTPFNRSRYPLKDNTIRQTIDFAYEMAFGSGGEHRDHRSGGTHNRKEGEIFADTFQGKLAEFAVFNMLHKDFPELTKPDLATYELGDWDDHDFIVNNKTISVKSTKNFGNLLLLEKKDWDENGAYIPNLMRGSSRYDFFILVRLQPFCTDLMKRKHLLYNRNVPKNVLQELIMREKWYYDTPGFVTLNDIKSAIHNKHIIPKGASLNGSTTMDAENYYIQSGDFRPLSELVNDINK
ncbi:hypothetical protein BCT06_13435 [Vibrio breoganii]|uniref:hypothetical protein n=1 Tax=Vibrio breoganii TaxID=553239 RepID=UPI000C842FE0|nr:hypothetical protein [Vibrio breoganii]PMO60108.1 hypothetical protein BCT06_13435 [Vibrio breoganii]